MVAGAFGMVMPCRRANPLRGRTCASNPGGSSIAKPVGTRTGTPGSSVTGSTACKSIPASSAAPWAYCGS